VLAAAGAVDHDALVEAALRGFEARAWGDSSVQKESKPGKRMVSRLVVEKDVTQVNLILARRSIAARDSRRHAMGLVNLALGGGMASRLNQELREKRGMAYSVYSFADLLLGAGAFGISLGTEPKQAVKAANLVRTEIDKMRKTGLSAKELRFAKDHASGAAVLALESPGARMQHLGKCQLVYGKPIGLDEILVTVGAVSRDEVAQVLEEDVGEVSAENGWTLAAVVPEGFDATKLLLD